MKIFHYENGVERVYVQIDDIIHINRLNQPTPKFIKENFNDIMYTRNVNPMEFIKFEDPEEIEYFKNTEWIVDYNECMLLSDEEMEDIINKLSKKMENIADNFNSMSIKRKKWNMHLREEYRMEEYKRDCYIMIQNLKSGKAVISLPNFDQIPNKVKLKTFNTYHSTIK